jgi:beta-glucosidase
MRMHKANLERHKQGPVDLLFIGDSITAGWLGRGKEIWEAKYAKLNTANFGIGGDRTENILWRIGQGELDNVKPKVVVLMIGTNNSHANTPAQIAAATGKILDQIKTKLPETRVLLVSMTPRGARTNSQGQLDDGVRTGTTVRETNQLTQKFADGDRVRWLDLTPAFTDAEGKPSAALLYDQLHPNAEGYAAWDKAMWPVLDEMLKAAPLTK